MAKKTTGKTPATKAPAAPTAAKRESPWAHRDTKTAASLQSLADAVVKSALSGREPKFDVPTRAASNTKWNKSRGILQMGSAVSSRELFNLGQARNFMQTLLHGQGIQALIAEGKTSSLRGMFYKGLHTIQGTKEKTFDDQTESDKVLEDLEVTLGALREELHVFAKKRGNIVGNSTVIDSGDEINCRRMCSGGNAIPTSCEPDVIHYIDADPEFIRQCAKEPF